LDSAAANVQVAKAQLEAAQARVQQRRPAYFLRKAETKQVAMKQADAAAKIAKVQQQRAAVEARS